MLTWDLMGSLSWWPCGLFCSLTSLGLEAGSLKFERNEGCAIDYVRQWRPTFAVLRGVIIGDLPMTVTFYTC